MRETLRNFCGIQREDGNLPCIYPTTDWGFDMYNGPGQNGIIVEIPYQLYRFTGNKDIIRENAEAIKKYFKFLSKQKTDDGMYVCGFGCDGWEWGNEADFVSSTPHEIYNTLNVLALFKKASFLFETIDDCSYANEVKEYETELLQAFRKKYVTEDLYVSCRSQTAQSVALLLDVFTEDEKKKAFENLLTLIDEVGAYKTGCGGVKALFIVLSKYGYDDLALKLMTQKDKMSFYKWIEQGMTSLGEFIYETHEGSIFRRDSGRILSRNHHQFGSISTWFYRYIGGMHINPNMDNPNYIVIKPHRFNEIGYVKITYARNGYELEYEVKKNSDKLDIVVLKNTGFDLEIG
jgi:alpha-L-rhamnosidase